MAGKVPVLYKPFGSPTSANPGKVTIVTSSDTKAVDIIGPDGKLITGTKKDTIRHIPEPGAIPGPYNQNWWGGPASKIPAGSIIRITNADGSYSYAKIENPYQQTRGFVDPGEGTSPENAAVIPADPRAAGPNAGGGAGGYPAGFAPGQYGQYGFFPAFLGNQFPSPVFSQYNPIQPAPYNFTDPIKFAKEFGDFNRGELAKNFQQAQNMGLQATQTELKGLQSFAPAAAALQRNLVSADNQFNQQQRTQQIDQTLPGVRGQLTAQGQRADTFAQGKLPSSIEDRAFEVASRSNAADISNAGGFGAQSSAAQKTSALLSAQDRVNLSKYGDQLLTQNIGTKANLLLAPTEYANAGSQIRVMPSVDSGTRAQQSFQDLNNATLISPTTAFTSQIQQEQFKTNLVQGTNQFNATNALQNSQFNANAANNFSLTQFGYLAGYANSVAGAAQTDANTQVAIQQQNAATAAAAQQQQNTQNANNIGAAAGIISAIGSAISGFSNSSHPTNQNTSTGNAGNAGTGAAGGVAGSEGDSAAGAAGSGAGADGAAAAGAAGGGSPASVDTGTGSSSTPPAQETPPADQFVGPPAPSGPSGPAPESPPASTEGPVSEPGARVTPAVNVSNPSNLARSANINPSHAVMIRNFQQTFKSEVPESLPVSSVKHMAVASHHALLAGGVSNTPLPGYARTGYNTAGNPVYSSIAMQKDNSPQSGVQNVHNMANLLAPFETFTPQDEANFRKLATLADPQVISTLDRFAVDKDAKGFAKFLNQAIKSVTSVKQGKETPKESKKSTPVSKDVIIRRNAKKYASVGA